MALLKYDKKNYKESINFLNSVLENNICPTFDVFYILGKIYQKNNEYKISLFYYEKALL